MEIILLLIMYFLSGVAVGCLVIGLISDNLLKKQKEIKDDLFKALEMHNKREIKLIYINQSIKDYVKGQINRIRIDHKDVKVKNATQEDMMYAANYIAFKDIEAKIKTIEEEAYRLSEKQSN